MLTAFITHLEQIHPLIPLVITMGMLGLSAGVLGCFTLLRGQSLFGDAMAHASLPGIALTFMATQTTNPLVLLAGGSCASLVGAFLLHWIKANTRLKIDAILGCILSFFFGTGLVLLAIIQRSYSAQQAILGRFLFGNAALLLYSDMFTIFFTGGSIVALVLLFWKEFSVFTFDSTFAQSIGYSARLLDMLLTLLFIVLIGIGIQTVGVLLITTLLIAPAAAARQWTSYLHSMALLAAVFGIFSTTAGTILSYYYETIPTGPAMVVIATTLTCVSLLTTSRNT
ncbi:metal ABC transporter permease [Candidatus Dependentiae bacterium]|nr:metal ABC transporter permease [Candidatus Dependentiae bacterium]